MRSPYETWISEIMLQQTQVITVIDYFKRWIVHYPHLQALSQAKESELLDLWSGLGYYSRARNILTAARQIENNFAGKIPSTRHELLQLKGIGEYTAGAILSLAFNLREPILDGNVIRVFSRLYALNFLPNETAQKKIYWVHAHEWAQCSSPGLANEALMEFGALICTPKNPSCLLCPLQKKCLAFLQGSVLKFPPAKPMKKIMEIKGYALVLESKDSVLMCKPQKPELLAGLFTFPILPSIHRADSKKDLTLAWAKMFPDKPILPFVLAHKKVRHAITHHQFDLKVAKGIAASSKIIFGKNYIWVKRKAISEYLISSLPKKIWEAAHTSI